MIKEIISKIKNKKIRKEIICYVKQFNQIFSIISGKDEKDIWSKNTDIFIKLLKGSVRKCHKQ